MDLAAVGLGYLMAWLVMPAVTVFIGRHRVSVDAAAGETALRALASPAG